jgi:hypothetical protein
MVKGGGLKSYVKTRWSTAFDCANSILSCENILKDVILNLILINYYLL